MGEEEEEEFQRKIRRINKYQKKENDKGKRIIEKRKRIRQEGDLKRKKICPLQKEKWKKGNQRGSRFAEKKDLPFAKKRSGKKGIREEGDLKRKQNRKGKEKWFQILHFLSEISLLVRCPDV